ncbi:hypothetical protein ADL05_12230 [Nocardiopsis sp. NRRL B-16309]|nr:hypothetical protein ADL05_12230 [Nocardiopsis sp. NRRL B-16309]
MRYVVSAHLKISEGTSVLDPLQQEGAVALLQNGLRSVEGIEGPDGMNVPLDDFVVAVYPGGAILKVFVDAPALEFAEASVHELCLELLGHSELLSEWTIDECEVQLHPLFAQKSLAAAEGPDAPPADVEARRAELARPLLVPRPQGPTAEETEQMRGRIQALAPALTVFGPESFGCDDDDPSAAVEGAELAAGALVYAIDLLVDELFLDLHTLTKNRTTVDDFEGVFRVLDTLPERFAHQYDTSFVRRFLVASIAMTARFTSGGSPMLSCVAEELALRLLLDQARVTLDLYGLLDDRASSALDFFAGGVFEDLDHEWLYEDEPSGLGVALLDTAVDSWFAPFGRERYVHPYTRQEGDGSGSE